MRQRLRAAGADAPLVHDQRRGGVDLVLVRLEIDLLQLGGVFGDEAAQVTK